MGDSKENSIKTISENIDNNGINHGDRIRKRHKISGTQVFSDFASNSSLHGLRYITEKTLSTKEKIFWLMTFLLSVVICGYLIRNVWIKWKNSPVIITVSEQPVPVGMIPFPSVTICPRIKCKASIYNYTAELRKLRNRPHPMVGFNGTLFDDILLLCKTPLPFSIIRKPTNEKCIQTLLEVAPTISETFEYCSWSDSMYESTCNTIVETVILEAGICFNINSLSANEILRMDNIQKKFPYLNATTTAKGWSLTNGYDKNEENPYPRRGMANTMDPDLSLLISENINDRDEKCQIHMHGFQLYLHHPTDMPQSSRHVYPIALTSVTSLAIKVNIMDSSQELMTYHPDIRQCFYTWERPLKYFKIYTLDNCKLECQTNYTYQKCGCVWFHMPYENSRKICTASKQICFKKVQALLAKKELNLDTEDSEVNPCNCLPACNSVEYEAEVTSNTIDLERKSSKIGLSYARVELYFKHSRYISMRRSEMFGLTDFFSNCGGLLGVFLGFSFLSLVEIFYYFTLRICFA